MNYIKELNSFYDWLEINSLSASGIALWHALMAVNNRAGWISEFTVAISTLETKTGLKKDAIIRARNRLQQLGRIEFKSRSGQQSAAYKIIPFESVNATLSATQNNCVGLNDTNCNANRELTATLTATQTASINKLNNSKLNVVVAGNLPPPVDNVDTEMKQVDVVLEHYCTKAGILNTSLKPKDIENARKLIIDKVPIEIIITGTDKALENFKPQFEGDAINSFGYCVPVIKGYWANEKAKEEEIETGEEASVNPRRQRKKNVGFIAPVNSFNSYTQRTYDVKDLENKLLGRGRYADIVGDEGG